MSYRITSQCIACYRCESICPTGAITRNEQQYQINPERCNDCVGAYAVPQCWAACPTNGGCVPTVADLFQSHTLKPSGDYWDTWFELYNRLVSRLQVNQVQANQVQANHQSDYWQRWFETYSQALSNQLHPPTSAGANA